MCIKTVVIDAGEKAKKIAKRIEETANEMEENGYEFLTFSLLGKSKAILAFRGPEEETDE